MFLPTSVWGEKAGTTTNLEGRVHARWRASSRPRAPRWTTGASRQELAARFGADFGFDTVEDVQDEIARVAPAYAGVDADLSAAPATARCSRSPTSPTRSCSSTCSGSPPAASWEPIPPGVAADESHLSSLGTGAVAASGTGADVTIKPGLATGDAPEDEDAAEAAVETAVEELESRPALHVWDRAVTAPDADAARRVQSPPRGRPHALRRRAHRVVEPVARRARVGESRCVVHPSDLERIGVSAEGDDVRVTSAARHHHASPCVADSATAPGTAFMAFAQRGDVGPNDIIDIAASVTELRVETTR